MSSEVYKNYRKNKVAVYDRVYKAFEDMLDYDDRLISFHPVGCQFNWLLTQEEMNERKEILDKFISEYKPQLEDDLQSILGVKNE